MSDKLSMTPPVHPPVAPRAATATAGPGDAEAQVPDDATAASFGDLLAELLRTLPEEASSRFLMSLTGLSAGESYELCDYVSKLKAEKQFRVIRAMAESTIEGKKKFLSNLRKKFEVQQAKEKEIKAQEDKDMEAYMKRKQAINAAQRVKMLNGGANKYHSFNAAVGAGVSTAKENVGTTANAGLPTAAEVMKQSSFSNLPMSHEPVGRSLSSSSVMVTKEDIKNMGKLLDDAHIADSEFNLRELEINKRGFAQEVRPQTIQEKENEEEMNKRAEMMDNSKRDRPDSSRELVKPEQKPTQRTRADGENDNDAPPPASLSNVSSTSSSSAGDAAGGTAEDATEEAVEDPEAPTTKRWTKGQDAALRESVRIHGEKNWKAIAELVPGRNHAQCLQRWRKVLKPGLVKGHWSFEEDQVLEYLVTQGCNNWGQIAERIPGRTPKQCRERWKNHLDPAINKGPYTEEEDTIILEAQARLGNKWSQIAQLLKGRTEDSVKIRWKSLKQNPAKAAASHAQHKKNMQQQQQQQAFQTNQAVMRQRQMQLLQQQQRLQHNEASQALEQQQQLQQQQLQKLLQQRHGMVTDNGMVKQEPYHASPVSGDARMMSPLPSIPIGLAPSASIARPDMYPSEYTANFTPSLQVTPTNSSPLGHEPIHYDPHEYSAQPAFGSFQQDRFAGPVLPSTSSLGYNQFQQGMPNRTSPAHMHDNSPVRSGDLDGNSWDLSDGVGMRSRLGENPPPAAFWDNYAKQMNTEPIPLVMQGALMHDPVHRPDGHDEVDDDAMFETLATELGSNTLNFAPL